MLADGKFIVVPTTGVGTTTVIKPTYGIQSRYGQMHQLWTIETRSNAIQGDCIHPRLKSFTPSY
jgi:hypothetical protein